VPETLRFIPPCSPVRAAKPPAGHAWLHEPKLDGYRLQIIKNSRAVRLYSRNGHDCRILCMVAFRRTGFME
jgi:bifunctional non-homologous end joining protein LigD